MSEQKKHVHCDLIKAWADGAQIQFEFPPGDWVDITKESPRWHPETNYRIKPQPKKCWVYLWKYSSEDIRPTCTYMERIYNSDKMNAQFVKLIAELEYTEE